MSNTDHILKNLFQAGVTVDDDDAFAGQSDHLLDMPDLSFREDQRMRDTEEQVEAVATKFFAEGLEREEELPDLLRDARRLSADGAFSADGAVEKDTGLGAEALRLTGAALDLDPSLLELDAQTEERVRSLGLTVSADGQATGFGPSGQTAPGLINDLEENRYDATR
ncbi:hypothetical protein [Microvirga puerhi]|uniref:Uncharacterized protein n=1 Tax=Microvirga puerhi TaxID=2876078 RepID=A0ABS7VTN2_9HYPH|nr:hypothetical protein [Microvirga puerhi]MBZ6078932.1 hypothetical protein [Microvirga puerhi]